MRAFAGILIAALLGLGIYSFYLTRSHTGAPGSTPAQTIDTSRAQMDLLAIAQAERMYFAEHGSYASLDELVTSGAIPEERTRLKPFSLAAETHADGFTVTARCQPSPGQSCTSFAVDQTMSVHSLP